MYSQSLLFHIPHFAAPNTLGGAAPPRIWPATLLFHFEDFLWVRSYVFKTSLKFLSIISFHIHMTFESIDFFLPARRYMLARFLMTQILQLCIGNCNIGNSKTKNCWHCLTVVSMLLVLNGYGFIKVAIWRSGNALVSINEVNLYAEPG